MKYFSQFLALLLVMGVFAGVGCKKNKSNDSPPTTTSGGGTNPNPAGPNDGTWYGSGFDGLWIHDNKLIIATSEESGCRSSMGNMSHPLNGVISSTGAISYSVLGSEVYAQIKGMGTTSAYIVGTITNYCGKNPIFLEKVSDNLVGKIKSYSYGHDDYLAYPYPSGVSASGHTESKPAGLSATNKTMFLPLGTFVDLFPIPEPNSNFHYWYGVAASEEKSNPYTKEVIPLGLDVNAYFKPKDWSITVNFVDEMNSTYSLPTVELFADGIHKAYAFPTNGKKEVWKFVDGGHSASLRIHDDFSFSFVGWSGDCSGTGNCDLSMNTDRNVTATFRKK